MIDETANKEPYLNMDEAYKYIAEERRIPCTPGSLANDRSAGRAFAFVKIRGRVFTTRSWIDEWLESITSPVVYSPSELRARKAGSAAEVRQQ